MIILLKHRFTQGQNYLTQTIPNMLNALLLIEISPASHFSVNEKTSATKALWNKKYISIYLQISRNYFLPDMSNSDLIIGLRNSCSHLTNCSDLKLLFYLKFDVPQQPAAHEALKGRPAEVFRYLKMKMGTSWGLKWMGGNAASLSACEELIWVL